MSETPRKLDPSFWLSLFFVVVIGVWVVTAAGMDRDTRLFPWIIGIPALALALRQLAADWQGSPAKSENGKKEPYPGVLDIAVDRSIPPEEISRHTIRTGYWLLTFACGIWFLGFLISIPLFIFFYLTSEAKAPKIPALFVAGFTFIFVWALFDQMMHLAWPESVLSTLLGYKFLQ
jgi:putative tricarboxylic transport membrane protein